MGPIYTLQDFLDMTRRRIGIIAFVVIAGCIASLYWAMSHVHVYQSSEVIQVEQPKINDELARSTVEGSSARRLQLIQQQLMARANLQEMIDQFGIYDNLVALKPSEKIDLLRRSVTINGVAAAREGFADDGTISVLTITAQMEEAQLARDVAHEFAERTRTLMAAQRREQTETTLAFFQNQEEVVLTQIAELESELEAYRRDNDLTLEGGMEFRMSELAQINEAILELDRDIITTQMARTQIDRTARAATVARAEREIDAQISTLTGQRTLLDQRRTLLQEAIQGSPEIQRQLTDFDRRMERETGVIPVVSIPELAPKFQSSKWRTAREKRRQAGKAGRAARMARHS